MNVKVEVITLTPEIANSFLDNQYKNRKVNERKVNEYIQDIKKNAWEINGETIKIDSHGKMIDGQHRCTAVVRSGLSIQTLVAYGVDKKTHSTIDRGKSRTNANAFEIENISNAAKASSLTRILYAYEKNAKDIFRASLSDLNCNLKFLTDLYLNNEKLAKEIQDGIKIVYNKYPKASISANLISVTAYILFARKNEEKAKEFISKLFEGYDLCKGSPILALRHFLIDYKMSYKKNSNKKLVIDQMQILDLYIRTWNNVEKNINVQKIKLLKFTKLPKIK